MNKQLFIEKRQSDWNHLDYMLNLVENKRVRVLSSEQVKSLGYLYRKICTDLGVVQSNELGEELEDYLNRLIARTHNLLYSRKSFKSHSVFRFFSKDFPTAIRKNAHLLIISALLFILPLLFAVLNIYDDPTHIFSLFPEQLISPLEEAYREGNPEGRSENQDMFMMGFYITNNIGIAFKCFAGGILLGIGTIVVLIYNGYATGLMAGYIVFRGMGENFFGFVSMHAPFELTAIFVAGAAGLRLGLSLINTKGLTRKQSLLFHGKSVIQLVLGAAAMLFIAAFVEGFLSPSSLALNIKFILGLTFWVIIILYFALAGRGKP